MTAASDGRSSRIASDSLVLAFCPLLREKNRRELPGGFEFLGRGNVRLQRSECCIAMNARFGHRRKVTRR